MLMRAVILEPEIAREALRLLTEFRDGDLAHPELDEVIQALVDALDDHPEYELRDVRIHSDYELYFQAYDRERLEFAGRFGWNFIEPEYRRSARNFVLKHLRVYRRQCRTIPTLLTAPSFVSRVG